MTCYRGDACECAGDPTYTLRLFCPHYHVEERQVGDLEIQSAAHWAKVAPHVRQACTDHIRSNASPDVLATWRRQYLAGFAIGSDDPRFHFGVGMHVRNALRDVLLDRELPDGLQWDDCYYGALESLFRGTKGAHLRMSGDNANRSDAVMAQRGSDDDSVDDFPTPPFAGRALFEHVLARPAFEGRHIIEPAANRGFLAEVIKEYVGADHVTAGDILDYSYPGAIVRDFLEGDLGEDQCGWVITNPPFRLAEQFFLRGYHIASRGVALLVRLAFLETQGRFERLFSQFPPSIIAQFVERVPMVEGRYDPGASTATAYTWLVWDKAHKPEPLLYPSGLVQSPFGWIPPCRAQLTRRDDAVLPALRKKSVT